MPAGGPGGPGGGPHGGGGPGGGGHMGGGPRGGPRGGMGFGGPPPPPPRRFHRGGWNYGCSGCMWAFILPVIVVGGIAGISTLIF